MASADSFQTFSMRSSPYGQQIARILASSINAVEPGTAVKRFVHREGDTLQVSDQTYQLGKIKRAVVLGIGKAALSMSSALVEILGPHLGTGLVITKHASVMPSLAIDVMEGGHPIPDSRSISAGMRALDLVASLGPSDMLFCLISGGGSALLCTPREGILLNDLQALNEVLLFSGASVDEINTLRRRLELLKGGRLAQLSHGAKVVSLILSDVVGDPLTAIASGPTAPDPTSQKDVLALIEKYELKGRIPERMLSALENAPETPKPGDPIFSNVQNIIVGSSSLAARAAMDQARQEGFQTRLLRLDWQGEARQVGFELATILRRAKGKENRSSSPACYIAGGETTVTVRGNGKGGRNAELALAAVKELRDYPDGMLIALSTDGEDGPTDAAGAVVTGDSFRRATRMGMQPEEYLARNDSYTFFAALNDLLMPGPTGTNVNDLYFLFT